MAVGRSLGTVSQRFVRFLLLFVALWLPVQTMAGLSVSVCTNMQGHEGAVAAMHEATESAMPCHEAMADDAPAHQDDCDNCGICHLASAGFMPSAALPDGLLSSHTSYALPAIVAPPSHIAEPPQHPPRDAT
jgi:hypothetical protein